MIAASRRLSVGLALALSSAMAAIIRQAACGCQTASPGIFLALANLKE